MSRRLPLMLGIVGLLVLVVAGIVLLRATSDSDDDTVEIPDDAVHENVNRENTNQDSQPGMDPVDDFIELGLYEAQQGNVEEAINAFEIALAAAEGADAALPNYYLGSVYMQMGAFDLAVEYLEAATAANPNMAPAWGLLGSAYLSDQRPMTAVEAFNQALLLDSDNPITLTNRGQAYMHISAFEQAKPDFDRAIELDPGMVAAYFNRGTYYLRTGDPAAAVDDFTTVLDLQPLEAAAHLNRAAAYAELGDNEAAISDLNMFLAFRPDDELRAEAEAMLSDLQGDADAGTPEE